MSFYGATDAWDFTTNTYLRGGIVGPSGLTFTRASVGYAERSDGIWQSFASGVARITDKGILIEGSRINRALYSRDLTNAAWTATNVTVARNQVGIDGTANSACSLTATAGNGTVLQAVTHASTGRYFSIWVKRITGTGTVEVTLDNGSTWTGVTVTSGWTRVGAAQTLANPTVGVRLVTDTDAIAVDFAQLEDGAFPTSPILVEGTAVTRAADIAIIINPAISYPLTLCAEIERGVDTGLAEAWLTTSNNTTNEEAYLFTQTNDTASGRIRSGGADQMNLSVTGAMAINTVYRLAMRVKTDDSIVARSGNLSTLDTSVTLPTILNRVHFGIRGDTGVPAFNFVRKAAILPVLTDVQLQQVTT